MDSVSVSTRPSLRRHASRLAARTLAAVSLLVLTVSGCTRQYWRDQADDRTYEALAERQNDSRWQVPRLNLAPDPYSRFNDVNDPDCSPLPPDDPAAQEYMQCVYGMRGSKCWDALGSDSAVENPTWLEPYGLDASVVQSNYNRPATLPTVKNLTLEESLGLAYRHSREYQFELESVYLNALALTFERFRFDVQFFGVSNRAPSIDARANSVPGVQDSVTLSPRAGVNKLLPSGGQFALELANNTVWLFGTNNPSGTQSVLSYSLVQPLLRNGGRRFALESLTQSERNVLYSVRDFARFRQAFFTNVVAGGRVSGGLSGVGGSFGGGGGGYLDLLRQLQVISNSRFNIRLQEEQIEAVRATASKRPAEQAEPLDVFPAGVAIPDAIGTRLRYDADRRALMLRGVLTEDEVTEILALSEDVEFRRAVRNIAQSTSAKIFTQDVLQLATNLSPQRQQLANNERALQDAIDLYKVQLGLPTDMPVTIDTEMLKPFELVDRRTIAAQDNYKLFVNISAGIDDDNPQVDALRTASERLAELSGILRKDGFEVTQNDFARFAEWQKTNPEELTEPLPELEPYDVNRDRAIFAGMIETLQQLDQRLERLRVSLADPDAPLELRQAALAEITSLRSQYLVLSQTLNILQVDLRVDLIPMNYLNISLEDAIAAALENRLDLMNVRASVVDARRQVEVTANQLQSMLDIVAEGDLRTRSLGVGASEPFDFRGNDSSFRAGLSFTTPIQLVRERNNYRTALINYQRARRNYMRAEDQVKFDIRQSWRQLEVLKRNFMISKRLTRISALQYDQNAENTVKPQGLGGGAGGGNQGLSLIQAFNSLLNAQNSLIQFWVQYETNRLNISRDMGTMEIDERGFWVDGYYQDRLRNAGYVTLPEYRLKDLPQVFAPGAAPVLPYGPATPSLEPTDAVPPEPADGTVPPLEPPAAGVQPAGYRRVVIEPVLERSPRLPRGIPRKSVGAAPDRSPRPDAPRYPVERASR